MWQVYADADDFARRPAGGVAAPPVLTSQPWLAAVVVINRNLSLRLASAATPRSGDKGSGVGLLAALHDGLEDEDLLETLSTVSTESVPSAPPGRRRRSLDAETADKRRRSLLLASQILPLQWFDDATLDMHSPAEWAARIRGARTASSTMPAQAPHGGMSAGTDGVSEGLLARVWCPAGPGGVRVTTAPVGASRPPAGGGFQETPSGRHLAPGRWLWCHVLGAQPASGTYSVLLAETPPTGSTDAVRPSTAAAPSLSKHPPGGIAMQRPSSASGRGAFCPRSDKVPRLTSHGSVYEVERLDVCFAVEDPTKFASRLAAAYAARYNTALQLLQAMVVDSLPTEGLPLLAPAQTDRMEQLVLYSAPLRANGANCRPMLATVQQHYQRTMNKLAVSTAPATTSSVNGVIDIPDRSLTLPHATAAFMYGTLLNNGAVLAVRAEAWLRCLHLTTERPIRLDMYRHRVGEFQALQHRQLASVVDSISATWVPKMVSLLTQGLQAAGKGWWSTMTDLTLFRLTKPYRLYRLVTAYMEDALRAVAWSSLAAYMHAIAIGTAVHTTVRSPTVVDVVVDKVPPQVAGLLAAIPYPAAAVMAAPQPGRLPRPLFMVEVVAVAAPEPLSGSPAVVPSTPVGPPPQQSPIDLSRTMTPTSDDSGSLSSLDSDMEVDEGVAVGDGGNWRPGLGLVFALEAPLRQFQEAVVAVYTSTVNALSAVPEVGPMVWNRMVWSHPPPVLKPLRRQNDTLSAQQAALNAMVGAHEAVLANYLSSLAPFLRLLNTKPGVAVEAWRARISRNRTIPLAPIVDRIRHHLRERDSVKAALPVSIRVGAFELVMGAVREQLAGIHDDIATGLQQVLDQWCVEVTDSVLSEVSNMRTRMRGRVASVEQAVEVERFVLGVPATVDGMQHVMAGVQRASDALGEFSFIRASRDLTDMWRCRHGVYNLLADLKYAVQGFPSRRAALREELSQAHAALEADAMQLASSARDLAHVATKEELLASGGLLEHLQTRLTDLVDSVTTLNTRNALLGNDASKLSALSTTREFLEPYFALHKAAAGWAQSKATWMEMRFMTLDAPEMKATTADLVDVASKADAQFQRRGNTALAGLAASTLDDLTAFQARLPFVGALRQPGLQARHWEAFNAAVAQATAEDASLPAVTFSAHSPASLKDAIAADWFAHGEVVQEVSALAAREYAVEMALVNMQQHWDDVHLELGVHTESGSYFLQGVDKLVQVLDEHAVATQTLLLSPYRAHVEVKLRRWGRTLALAADVLEEWMTVQRGWLRLWPLFEAPDLALALPAEAKLFAAVHKHWERTLTAARRGDESILPDSWLVTTSVSAAAQQARHDGDGAKGGSVIQFCASAMLLEKFQESRGLLEKVQRGLHKYLETKRSVFGRFYFLSDDELLELLSRASDPTRIQPHLSRCFEGIHRVEFRDGNQRPASSRGKDLWGTLRPESAASRNMMRRRAWSQSLRRMSGAPNTRAPSRGSSTSGTRLGKLVALQREDHPSLAAAALRLLTNAARPDTPVRHEIVAMSSASGESVPFPTAVSPGDKPVEVWMVELEAAMVASVKDRLAECLLDYDRSERLQWATSWPAMCVLTAACALWTHDVECVLRGLAPPKPPPAAPAQRRAARPASRDGPLRRRHNLRERVWSDSSTGSMGSGTGGGRPPAGQPHPGRQWHPASPVVPEGSLPVVREWQARAVDVAAQGLPTSLDRLRKAQLGRLRATVGLVRSGHMAAVDTQTLSALTVLDVHARDVLTDMVQAGVCDVASFGWLRHLRFYVEHPGWVAPGRPSAARPHTATTRAPRPMSPLRARLTAMDRRSVRSMWSADSDAASEWSAVEPYADHDDGAEFGEDGATTPPRGSGAQAAAPAPASPPGAAGCAVAAAMMLVRRPFGYEYLGNTPRLVVTPLTERCYRTCMGALHHNYGAAPEGPAGTGKTETVKDLAKALAMQCIVFNCSEGLDHVAMGKIFRGLAQCGAWACFDEFNRIEVEVLSVIAQQVVALQSAARQQAPSLFFEGVELSLSPQFSVFITMNPGYAGRTELPDNLKVLFRPVAMMVPDYAFIAEIMLFAAGFQAADLWGPKVVAALRLCSVQLPAMAHYDYGMRAVHGVVLAARGVWQQAARLAAARGGASPPLLVQGDGGGHPPRVLEEEGAVIVQALMDANLAKVPAGDVPQFKAIVGDVFRDVVPGGVPGGGDHLGALRAAVARQARRSGLQATPAVVSKCVQVWNTTRLRGGVMLVGASGGGKSTIVGLLVGAVSRLPVAELGNLGVEGAAGDGVPAVTLHTLFPKAMSLEALYGYVDPSTRLWRDGVFSSLFRWGVAHAAPLRWLLCDGPVDAAWIENLNTLLDDSRRLCLANGETIAMPPAMGLLFETDDLSQATPATVSRCGMVYVDAGTVTTTDLLESWLASLDANVVTAAHQDLLRRMFEALFHGAVEAAAAATGGPLPLPATALAGSMFRLLSCHLLAAIHGAARRGQHLARDWEQQHKAAMARAAHEAEHAAQLARQLQAEMQAAVGAAKATGLMAHHAVGVPQLAFGAAPAPAPLPDPDHNDAANAVVAQALQSVFLQCLVWGVGGALAGHARDKFSLWLHAAVAELPFVGAERLPAASRSLFEVGFDALNTTWTPWAHPDGEDPASLFVPVGAVAGVLAVADALLASREHVLLTGGPATGKSAVLQQLLGAARHRGRSGLLRHKRLAMKVLLSASSTAPGLADAVEAHLERRRRRVHGPPGDAHMVIGVEDVHLPTPSTYGDQPPLELLRQLLSAGGWHVPSRLTFRYVVDVGLAASLRRAGDAGPSLRRLARHFNALELSVLPAGAQVSVLRTMAAACLDDRLDGLGADAVDVAGLSAVLATSTVALLAAVQHRLRATPATPHYTFSFRDAKRIVTGALRADERCFGYQAVVGRLWLHEAVCCVRERLVSATHTAWLDGTLWLIFQRWFRSALSDVSAMPPMALQASPSMSTRRLGVAPIVWADVGVDVELRAAGPPPSEFSAALDALVFGTQFSESLDATRLSYTGGSAAIVDAADTLALPPPQYPSAPPSPTAPGGQLLPPPSPAAFDDDDDDDDDDGLLSTLVTTAAAPARRLTYRQAAHSGAVVERVGVALRKVTGLGGTPRVVLFQEAVVQVARLARLFEVRPQEGGTGGASAALWSAAQHAVVLGLGGTGRSTAVELAAAVVDARLAVIRGGTQGRDAWREVMRRCVLDAVLDGVAGVLLVSDTVGTPVALWEDVHALVQGSIPQGLLAPEDVVAVTETFRSACEAEGMPPTALNVLHHASAALRGRLCVAGALSPVGPRYRQLLHRVPSVLSATTPLWFRTWPDAALETVASRKLATDTRLAAVPKLPNPDALAPLCRHVHKAMEYEAARGAPDALTTYVTPASFIDFLADYGRLAGARAAELASTKARLEAGLASVTAARAQVGALQEEVRRLEPQIVQAQADAAAMQEQVVVDQAQADTWKKEVEQEEAAAVKQAEDMEAAANEARADLAQAMPALEEAVRCLRQLRRSDLDEVRSMARPPFGVRLTMEAACIMFDVRPMGLTAAQKAKAAAMGFASVSDATRGPGDEGNGYWGLARATLLSDAKELLRSMLEFDKDSIDAKKADAIRPYIDMDGFQPEVINRVSKACTAICLWVRAMHKYYHVRLVVEPKREAVAAATAAYEATLAALAGTKAKLAQARADVAALQAKQQATLRTQESLELQLARCQRRADSAVKLTNGLREEASRWAAQLDDAKAALGDCAGDCLLAAATVAYLGPYPGATRARLLDEWVYELDIAGVRHAAGAACHLPAVFGNPLRERQWRLAGLPPDALSTANAVILFGGGSGSASGVAPLVSKWPLIVDPQGQALRFVKSMARVVGLLQDAVEDGQAEGGDAGDGSGGGRRPPEKRRATAAHRLAGGMDVVKHSHPHLADVIQTSMMVGRWVLVEGVGATVDPCLLAALKAQAARRAEPVGGAVSRGTVSRAGGGGDTAPTLHPDFQLFLATPLARPVFPPEVCVKVTLLNFSISSAGLEEQLLHVITQRELPQLEASREALRAGLASTAADLEAVEERMLLLLSQPAVGNLLDDVQLVDTMEAAEATAVQLKQHMADSAATAADLEASRDMYRPLAQHGVALYHLVASLTRVDSMYQFSLPWFKALFGGAVADTPRGADEDMDARVAAVGSQFTLALRTAVCQGLYARHRRPFDLLLASVVGGRADPGAFPNALWHAFVHARRDWLEAHSPQAAGRRSPRRRGSATGAVECPPWLPLAVWADLSAMASCGGAPHVLDDVRTAVALDVDSAWEAWHHGDADALPCGFDGRLVGLARLCVVRCLRPDLLLPAVDGFVVDTLGARFGEAPRFDMATTFALSGPTRPILFLLSPGLDPLSAVTAFAQQRGEAGAFTAVALGKGQGAAANRAIKAAATSGGWVLLLNCHLFTSWLPSLEQTFDDLLAPDAVHPGFRLWMTSLPTPAFPSSVLQHCVKVATEPVVGLVPHLRDAVDDFDEDAMASLPTAQALAYGKLVWALVAFHAIAQCRRRFGTLGWNVPYEFSRMDLRFSKLQLREFVPRLGASGSATVALLSEVFGAVNYGGRISDDCDLRTAESVLVPLLRLAVGTGSNGGPALEAAVQASTPWSLDVFAPPKVGVDTPTEVMLHHIASFPAEVPPGAMGLPDVAQVTAAHSDAGALLRVLEPLSGAGREAVAWPDTGPVADMVAKLLEEVPEGVEAGPLPKADAMGAKLGNLSAVLAPVVAQEVRGYAALLRAVRAALGGLQAALNGEAGMTPELQHVADAVGAGRVPQAWLAAGFPSVKPLRAWSAELRQRVAFVREWVGGAATSLWLPGMLHPRRFLSAVLQAHGRRHDVPLDGLTLHTNVVAAGAGFDVTDGCVVHGLFLEAAAWDAEGGHLAPPPVSRLHSPLPPVHLVPVPVAGKGPMEGVYRCPVYRTTARTGQLSTAGHSTNFVFWLLLPAGEPTTTRRSLPSEVTASRGGWLHDCERWVRGGVAAVLALPD